MATVAVLLAVATRPAAAACTGDLDDSGQVDVVDMLDLLAQWGQPGVTDLDGDGDTSVTDLLQLLASWGVCPDATNVIVVYNVNSPDADGNGASDALEIAQYYATARGLDSSVLCPVELPPGQYATPDELLSARRTILEDCICALSPPEVQQATGCSIDGPGNIEAISDGSPITHMVLIRGLPARLFDTGWPNAADSDKKGPSFDYYLSYLLNHDEDIFPNNLQLSLPLYAPTSTAYGYQPPLDPGEHGMLAYGRVEAITKQRTFDLIDRTLAAEAAGVKGSFLLESSEPALYDMTATFDDACFDYLSHEPFVFGDPANSWPYAQCRVGSTDSTSAGSNPGEIPGEPNTTIPFAIDAGFFYGEIAVINRFKAFDGFDNMLNWHRAVEDCVELCKDCDGDNGCDQATCFANSTDYLGEINTDCVGVSPGFIAFQNSSFAVQQYGFWPPGWVTARGSAHDRSVPRVVQGDAFDDGMQFTDDLYVHYGAFDHLTPDASTCADVGTCAEHIAVNLALYQDIPDIPLDGAERQFTMRFRYRYDPPAGLANPKLKTRLRFTLLDGGGGSSTTDSPLITISDGAHQQIEIRRT